MLEKKRKFIIGTRGSLLAKTQCTLFKEHLERESGQEFELKYIVTEGDQKTDKPLWQMDGQNFFTKELDQALLNNEVDFVVHSYKDLGSQRPKGSEIAAISKRSFAEDILLIHKDTLKKLPSIEELIIGTSSPRRVANLKDGIKDFIPCGLQTKISTKVLRGNVNSRIEKLKKNQYHAIVLAMAGLERLASREDSLKELKTLTKDLDFMILPQKFFPSSASQGALAVEINQNSPRYEELKAILKFGHDEKSALNIAREREIFNSYGGGCHLAVGIHHFTYKGQNICIEKGEFEGKKIHKIQYKTANSDTFDSEGTLTKDTDLETSRKTYSFTGKNQKLLKLIQIDSKDRERIDFSKNIFITSSYALKSFMSEHSLSKALDGRKLDQQTLWTSGASTHKKAARLGLWINASADGLGHEKILSYKKSKLISSCFLEHEDFQVLSHSKAQSALGEVLGVYKREINEDYKGPKAYDFNTCYWGSFEHYQIYTERFPKLKAKKHACGLGKTYDQFIKNGISVTPIVSVKN